MKLSFSTLGCPGWDLAKVLDYAVKYGYDAVDIRGLSGVMKTEDIPEFQPERIEATKAAFAESGVKLLCIGTSCSFHAPDKFSLAIDEGKRALDLCATLGVPYIRVFGNSILSEDGAEETKAVIEGISILCDYSDSLGDKGAAVLLEVHGDFNTVDRLLPICRALEGRSNFGLIWDYAHSERVDESPVLFWRTLKKYIKHVHIKDHTRESDGKRTLCPIGSGVIPIKETVRMMIRDGFDGYFALEHELAWHPELQPAEVVIPHYSSYMKDGKYNEKGNMGTLRY